MPRRVILSELAVRWLFIGLVVLLSLAFLQTHALQRIDFLLYDYALALGSRQASEQVVILAIDDASLQELGRWPWSRQLQADLLSAVTAAEPLAVGFDVLFSEAQQDNPEADDALARAVSENGRTVLAVAPSKPTSNAAITEILPLPDLAAAAAALGHVDIEIDSDGLCRRFFTHGGLGGPHWPALSLAMLQVSETHADGISPPGSTPASDGWVRHAPHYIPYARGPDPIRTLSAARFLSDPGLTEELRSRYVLIGSTATGLGDFVSTPVSYDHERMPGVEVNAHILSGLLAGRIAADIPPGWQTVLTVALSGAGAALIVMTSFPLAAMVLAITVVLAFGLSVALLFVWQSWFAPATALAPVIISFPVWGVWSLVREKRINRVLSANVQYQTMHHQATGLPNQHVLEERLRQIGDRASDDRMAMLLIVHVSRSDSIGGMTGDAGNSDAQRAISARLISAARADDLVVHLSGGDFAVFRGSVETSESATQFATHIMDRLRVPLEVNTATLYLVPRMGMSLWPADTDSGPGLLSTAYTAMFRARIERADTPRRFSEDVAREVEAHAQLERSLVSALENSEFEVYYQPLVRSENGRCIGVEALLRWHNPELGLVYPATFIPVAEHNGLIREIGGWVLSTACRQVSEWADQGLGPIRLAVNLSPLQFNDGNVIEVVKAALAQSGLAPDSLELEITESALMQNTDEAIRLMLALKDIGVHLAIDDFGTGYSSLSHLRHFPFDRIKIDRTFTQDVPGQGDVNEIALTIIDMARRMKRSIVVEGIEQPEQAQFFQSNGCEEMQGYLFGHPVPADELVDLLRRTMPT